MFEFSEKIQDALKSIDFTNKPRRIEHILNKPFSHDDLKTHANSVYFYLDNETFEQKIAMQKWCLLVCVHNGNSQIEATKITKEADQYINAIKEKFKTGAAGLGFIHYLGADISSYEPTFLVVKLNFLFKPNC
jgi:hypothetical protein